jgi:alcohol dehydrogenase (cytochrome c)/quinohemoprotein ethanol dehydrogenase
MAFRPLTELVYIPGQESSGTYRIDPNFAYTQGARNTGMASGMTGTRQIIPQPDSATAVAPKEPEGAENQPKATGGFLVAWDPKTQKERWRLVDAGGFGGGGKLATAGNLVFHGAIAYNAETGDKLWEASVLTLKSA